MATANSPTMIDEIIAYRNNKQIYFNLCQSFLLDNNIFKKDSVLENYRDVIRYETIDIDLSDRFEERYIYRPKYVSFDIYGTIDLWYLLLWINNMPNSSNFNKKIIKIFNPENMMLLNKIINIEKNKITKYKKEPYEIIK